LQRRFDRKQKVQEQMSLYSIQPSWVTAVDGLTLDPSAELKQLFLGNDFGSRRSVIGCALSHYQLWQQLLADPVHDYYLVMEDDVTLCDQFKSKLDAILQDEYKNKNKDKDKETDILFLGYSMFPEQRKKVEDVYDSVDMSTVHPFQPNLYIGGFFSYIIYKSGAQKCIDYIKANGIQHGIDYLMKIIPNLNIQEVRPFLVHTPCYQPNAPVDTDIQTNATNLFAEYDQFDYVPQQDQIGNDVHYCKGTLQEMLTTALQQECAAFNTLGFFKNKIDDLTPSPYFQSTDGIYIKK